MSETDHDASSSGDVPQWKKNEQARFDQQLEEERISSARLLRAQQIWHEQEMSKQRRQMESVERDLRRQMELCDGRKLIAVSLGTVLLLTIGIIIGANL